jgi:hypothetical protein
MPPKTKIIDNVDSPEERAALTTIKNNFAYLRSLHLPAQNLHYLVYALERELTLFKVFVDGYTDGERLHKPKRQTMK